MLEYRPRPLNTSPTMRNRTQFSCQQCGQTSPKWIGRCPSCQQWNTFVEEDLPAHGLIDRTSLQEAPVRFSDLDTEDEPRVSTGIDEFDRVLGGGVVPGALILLGGDPGVGKSTLMLDVASRLGESGPILYASGEESSRQIKLRGERMQVETRDLQIYSEMSVERILSVAEEIGAIGVVVDSIQTAYSEKLDMTPGSLAQVREVASRFLLWTKKRHVPVFLIGHITKDGAIAGPKALEHIVDTVLYFEGPRQHPHRIIRTIKNRFGPSNELGIFEMGSAGLHPVSNPSGLFLSTRNQLDAGSSIACCMEGSRPLLVEIQALVSRTHFGTPRRLTTGVHPQRLALLAAVIEKRLSINLWENDIYLNVVGGLDIDEPAADLAIVAAIVSSLLNRSIRSSTVIFGEVGLSGEIRACLHPEMRLKEAKSLGFSEAMIPKQTLTEHPTDFDLLQVSNLPEAVDALFGSTGITATGGGG